MPADQTLIILAYSTFQAPPGSRISVNSFTVWLFVDWRPSLVPGCMLYGASESFNCEPLAHFPQAPRKYRMGAHTPLKLSNSVPQKFVGRLLNYIGKILFFNPKYYDLGRIRCFSLLSK